MEPKSFIFHTKLDLIGPTEQPMKYHVSSLPAVQTIKIKSSD